MNSNRNYVLVTPARNEQATIGITLESVIKQTVLPVEWVIVSDGSTDQTDAIVENYARSHPFIRLLALKNRPARNFASVVFVSESGIKFLETKNYSFLGLLDADVRFQPNYFETLLERFEASPRIGLSGGLVLDVGDKQNHWKENPHQDVAGAVQLFRRTCFESLGGLVALPEGGWDAITNFQSRANGYLTVTHTDLIVDHLKPRNSAEGGMFRRKWQLGIRDYALGYHPVFEILKCLRRWRDRPFLIAAIAQVTGFFWSTVTNRPRSIPSTLIAMIRSEQKRRMLGRGKSAAAATN